MARIDAGFGRSAGVNAAQVTPERRENFEQLGRSLEAVGGALEERRQFSAEVDRIRQGRADDLALTELSTRASVDFSKRLDAEADAFDGSEGGFGDRMRGVFDGLIEDEVSKQPPRRQREARMTLLRIAQGQSLAAFEIEDRRRDAFVLREGTRQAAADANAVRLDPAFFTTAKENHRIRLDAMPAALRAEFDETRKGIDLAYGEARIDDDPDGFIAEAKSGRLQDFDPDILNRLIGSAMTESDRRKRQAITDARLARAEAQSFVKTEIDGMQKAVEAGLPVSAARLDALASAAAAGGPQAQALFQQQAAIIRGVEFIYDAPFADSAAELSAERQRLTASGDTDAASVNILTAMEKAHGAVMRRAEADFAGFLIDAQPDRLRALSIDEMDAATLRFRAGQVDALADYYGVSKKNYFSDPERAALQRRFIEDPKGAVEAAAIMSALPQGTAMLAEIAPKAPELAHLGGLLSAGGDEGFIDDATSGAARTRRQGFKTAMSKSGFDAARNFIAPAFALYPESGDAAVNSARFAYEERAAREGLTADEFSAGKFERALQQAAGGVFDVRGQLRGGVQDYASPFASGRVLLPNWMKNGDLKGFMRALTKDDLGVDVTDEAGNSIRLDQLRRAYPVAVGDGLYQLAFGDPSVDPQWARAGDQPFVLDLSKMRDRLAGPAPIRQPAAVPARQPSKLLGE